MPFGAAVIAAPDGGRLAPLTAALAESNAETQFRMDRSVDPHGFVQVAIHAEHLEDLYAFELKVAFDPDKLRLLDAELPSPGFALQPQVNGNEVKLVYTRTGYVAGHKGGMELATLSFERVGAGATNLSLVNVSLVDSQLNRVDLQPSASMDIPAHAGRLAFPDIAGHWAEATVREAAGQGWVAGYEDGNFRPDRPVTRAELAALLARAFGLTAAGAAPDFADAPAIAAWAKSPIAAAQAAGLMGGYEDGAFRPETPVSRAELSVVLSRALELDPGEETRLERFADGADIPSWARPAASALTELDFIRGKVGNRFAPLDFATRAEVCTLILKALPRVELKK